VSTSCSSNVHGVVDDNSNPCMNMVIDTMRKNQGYANECSIVDKEPNANATSFFNLLKNCGKSLLDGFINYSKLSIVAHVFTIKSDHELSEADYDRVVEWARNILLEVNRLKENFYVAKSMMKTLGHASICCTILKI
jgi:hypothetical protein